ncbi:MAG: hypothetical protein C0471_18225 [Erythrobacter sp.]|nr:hypothetical protein [Erythrobacter sp.]
MGRVGSIHRRDGSCPADAGLADATYRLCRNGALARVAGGHSDRGRNVAADQAISRDSHQHLSCLLAPLHHDPASLARRLLYRFGSIGRIVHASDVELRHAAKVGEKWVDPLLMVRRLIHDGMRETIVRTRLGEDREAMFSYLLMTMGQLPEERMLAVFADADGFVISEEIIAKGEAAHILVTPRKVFTRALNLDARKILLAHNHPSGCAEPSMMDIEQTRLLDRQAAGLGLVIEDHLIVGANIVTSMRDRGVL